MGIFSSNIKDIKGQEGNRKVYGWCNDCAGYGKLVSVVSTNPIRVKKFSRCNECQGAGKKWYFESGLGVPSHADLTSKLSSRRDLNNYYRSDFCYGMTGHVFHFYVYRNQPELIYKGQEKKYGCRHDWKQESTGSDSNHPRIWYRCSKCEATGVAENSGESIVER